MIAEEIELLRYLPLIYEELHPQRLSGKAKRTKPALRSADREALAGL